MEINLITFKDKIPNIIEQCCVYNHDKRVWFIANICKIGRFYYWENQEVLQSASPDDIYFVLPTFG